MLKQGTQMSFSTYAISQRKIKAQFFDQINILIDWQEVDNIITKYYQKGESATGRPPYSGLLLFKMGLLQTWYGLSDYEVEEQVNDSLSFMRFVGLQLEDSVPDNSVISRFRTCLTKAGAYEGLLDHINNQLASKGVIVKKGTIVDASVTQSPRKPKGKTTYVITQDREEASGEDKQEQGQQLQLIKQVQPGVDQEARWLKKAGKLHYGYKKHHLTDEEGLILKVITTPANESDIKHLENLLKDVDLEKGTPVFGDKGYASAENRKLLKDKNLKDRLQHKAQRGKPLSKWAITFNKLISKTRYKVERTFGGQRRWFKAGLARYVGQAKTHTQHLMEAMAYNLYRAPGMVIARGL